MKEKILMVGLGAMGSVLARLLLEKDKTVTVWNRSEEKTLPLRAMGAAYTKEIGEAVTANDIILICLQDYTITEEVLQGISLKGKTIVQLSTGTPQDARSMAASFAARGAQYLDGAILATPSQMGTTHTPIFPATKRPGPLQKLQYGSSVAGVLILVKPRVVRPLGTLPRFPVCSA